MIFLRESDNVTNRSQENDSRLSEPKKIAKFRKGLLRWYKQNGRTFPWRKSSITNYQRIVAEILLQRTRAETVSMFFPDFIREFPSWNRLSFASIKQLQSYLQPIGLWRRRAVSIHALSREMVKRRGRFPRNRNEIEALPGIGQYISNAVLLFCFGVPQPLLDINMARVLERVFGPRRLADIRYDPYLQNLSGKIVNSKDAKELNWAILDLAASLCLSKTPTCKNCPVCSFCKYAGGTGHGLMVKNNF